MEYINVLWMHASLSEPTRLVSELDQDRMEVRKLEFFRDGTVGFASVDVSSHGTRLGKMEVPPMEEINQDPEFRGGAITGAVFEELWKLHAHFMPTLPIERTLPSKLVSVLSCKTLGVTKRR